MPHGVLTALLDDCAGRPGLAAEHGLSFHIALPGLNLLFDCGESGMVTANAAALDIPLERLDMVAISHGHHDHGNGFPALAETARIERLLTGPGFFTPKHRLGEGETAYLGVNFDPDFLTGHSIRHELCHGLVQIHEACWAVGGFGRDNPDAAIPRNFVLRSEEGWRQDDFGDEICLALRYGDGVAVVAGCSHPGIVAMATAVRDRLDLPVRGVWGGVHLFDREEEEVAEIIRQLRELGANRFGFNHCSGEAARELVRKDPNLIDCPLHGGAVMEFSW